MSDTIESPPQAHNPILEPAGPASQGMPRAYPLVPPQLRPTRPSAPFGIGITLIIGASVLLLFSGVTIAVNIWLKSSLSSGTKIPDIGTNGVQLALTTALAALCLIALAAGIGLVRYRTWGRQLSIGWAVAALAYVVTSTAVSLLYIMPASRRAMQEMALSGSSSEAMRLGMAFGMAMTVAWAMALCVTPTLTLILMTRPKVKQCCA